jgi:cyclic pyranopterin monophosphate synthase
VSELPHLDDQGAARMVDIGAKEQTERYARAEAMVRMSPDTARAVGRGDSRKGDVVGTARLAGIQAAKRTGELIPLAHPLPLTFVGVDVRVAADNGLVVLTSEVRTVGRTGVEMEALCAVSAAALTVYDMCKAVDRGMRITDIRLRHKAGGRSGSFSGT